MSSVKIHFLGAAQTVTGSKFLIETIEKQMLVDCGMFQGLKELRQTNWKPLPVDVSKIDFVLLTHGHLDHVGYLPRLVKAGFKGSIIATPPTLNIAKIILQDSAKIHEEEAEKANKEGYSKHKPALPFYTAKDVEKTVALFSSVAINDWNEVSQNISFRFQYNAHIIGATFIELTVFGKQLVFSGDIGRETDLLLYPFQKPKKADYLVLESTYGNRQHPNQDIEKILASAIKETITKRGKLVIPSFAVERMQLLAYLLWKMYKSNKIPNIQIVIDSPMGVNVLELFKTYSLWHKLPLADYNAMLRHVKIITSYRETWETIDDTRPMVVIAGSGMVSGGRVLTYLRQWVDDATTTVMLVGYQAEGTRGRQLLEGAKEIKIFGKYIPVRATIAHVESLSAHADQNEIINWLSDIQEAPNTVFLVHGELDAMQQLSSKIKDIYGWKVAIPKLNEVVVLD